jgi:hypothetical protein
VKKNNYKIYHTEMLHLNPQRMKNHSEECRLEISSKNKIGISVFHLLYLENMKFTTNKWGDVF